jgi:hypothetical protein
MPSSWVIPGTRTRPYGQWCFAGQWGHRLAKPEHLTLDDSAPNIGRGSRGCGVGIEAFASPMAAQAITPAAFPAGE